MLTTSWAAALLLSAPALAQEPPSAEPRAAEPLAQAAAGAQRDYEKSLADLATLHESIRNEKIPMSQEQGNLERTLADLRRRYDDVSRSQDGRALEVTNLTSAMKLRQDETTYISNLLDEYARGFDGLMHVSEVPRYAAVLQAARRAPQNNDLTTLQKLDHQVGLLRGSIDRLNDLVGGARFEGEAVDPKGTVAKGEFTLVGPVALFASGGAGAAGLAVAQTGSALPSIRTLSEAMTAGLKSLVAKGSGMLPLDPTRGGALQELVARGSLIGTFKKGGPIMWPLLFVSLLASTVIIERLIFLGREGRARDEETVERIMERVGEGDVEGAIAAGQRSNDYVARALTYALRHRQKSLSNALMRSAAQELQRYNRGIAILDTCVTMAPLLGLLGTVTGMMGSFSMMGGGELSAPAQITGGIAEALIATTFGLGIAVTALIPMNYLHSRSDGARHEIEDASTHLELLMKPVMDAEAAAPFRGAAPRVASVPAAAWVAVPEP